MPQKLKIEDDASQRFQTTLGEQTVYVSLAWHDISESWFVSIESADGSKILSGRRMSTNTSIFAGIFTSKFAGTLIPVSLAKPVHELVRNSFTTTHTLTYYAEGESYADLP